MPAGRAHNSTVALFQGNFATAIKSSTFCFCHSIETLRFNRYTCYLQLQDNNGKRKLTAVCSHQTRIGNLDAHLI
ncbi:hypothetical protein DAE08_11535 [Escherichia coli]|nr:hypothetical protein [Escherichia coli]